MEAAAAAAAAAKPAGWCKSNPQLRRVDDLGFHVKKQ
jgi:hypothetical protein